MLKTSIIGHIGADAVVKSANGKDFTTFRVAHTESWKGADGVAHDETVWVDVIMQGSPAVLPYLTRGQLVFAEGSASLRVYSSPKERCMKAGLTINARSVELLGGKSDEIPSVLYSPTDGTEKRVTKHYYCGDLATDEKVQLPMELHSRSGERFTVDPQGWVSKVTEE